MLRWASPPFWRKRAFSRSAHPLQHQCTLFDGEDGNRHKTKGEGSFRRTWCSSAPFWRKLAFTQAFLCGNLAKKNASVLLLLSSVDIDNFPVGFEVHKTHAHVCGKYQTIQGSYFVHMRAPSLRDRNLCDHFILRNNFRCITNKPKCQCFEKKKTIIADSYLTHLFFNFFLFFFFGGGPTALQQTDNTDHCHLNAMTPYWHCAWLQSSLFLCLFLQITSPKLCRVRTGSSNQCVRTSSVWMKFST